MSDDDALLTRLRRICATVDPPPHVVANPLSWSVTAADPLADMRALAAQLATVPFQRHRPVLVSARHYDLYQRELARLDALNRIDNFRREIARRRLVAKRLTPMYTAYRHRARRRRTSR